MSGVSNRTEPKCWRPWAEPAPVKGRAASGRVGGRAAVEAASMARRHSKAAACGSRGRGGAWRRRVESGPQRGSRRRRECARAEPGHPGPGGGAWGRRSRGGPVEASSCAAARGGAGGAVAAWRRRLEAARRRRDQGAPPWRRQIGSERVGERE